MKLHSLRLRLLVSAAVFISAALALSAFMLTALFEHHVERSLDRQLQTYLEELIGRVEPDGKGGIVLTRELPDPRFDQPLSGLYWQVQDDVHRTLIRSRSLWDHVLPLPKDHLSLGVVHHHTLAGPDGQSLLVREQQAIMQPDTNARRLRFAVGVDKSDLMAARTAFGQDLLPYLAVLAAALMLATWLQVRTGLSPLNKVRLGVLAIRAGKANRLPSSDPDEVRPLVEEINELLTSRDQAVADARAWTADLAHGLKTPLSALGADAQRLRERGEHGIADDLEELGQSMRRRVDRELIRARLRSDVAGRPRHADLVPVLDGVVGTLRRTPDGEGLDWQLAVPGDARVNLAPDDLAELLGNLLDNAVKWARGKVRVSAERQDGEWQLLIEDDGPGVPAAQRERLGQRGLRLDEQTAGNGLGLAIARDIIAAYRGRLALRDAMLGGLAVHLSLPAAVDG